MSDESLDERIKSLCEERGLEFMPWECEPWNAPDSVPDGFHPQDSVWARSLPQAVRLRRRLIAELEAGEVNARHREV
jgi:hypothetical protein